MVYTEDRNALENGKHNLNDSPLSIMPLLKNSSCDDENNDLNNSNMKYKNDSNKVLNETRDQIEDEALLSNGGEPQNEKEFDLEKSNENELETVIPKSQTRAWILLIVLAITDFVTFASITILSPFFPAEAERKNATPTEYGTIIGIFELVALLVANVCIKAVAVVSPKRLIVSGIVLLGISTAAFGLLDNLPGGVVYFVVALLLRSLQGAGAGVIDVCSYMVATNEMPNRVSTAIGILEMAVGMGLTAGPAAGGILYEYGGYGLPFFALGILTLVLSPINYVVFPRKGGKTGRKLQNVLKFLKDLEVVICIISITSGGAVLGFLTGVLEPHLRQFDLSPSTVGLVTITTGAVFALTTPIWGHVCDKKINAYYLMFAGCILCGAGFFCLGPFPGLPFEATLWLILLALVLCGLGAAAQSVCPYGLMLRSAKRNGLPEDVTTSALVSAIHITSSNLGCFIGPFVGGLFLEFLGFRNGTSIMVSFQILLVLGMIFTWRRYR